MPNITTNHAIPKQTFKMADICKTRNGAGVTTTGNGKKKNGKKTEHRSGAPNVNFWKMSVRKTI